MCMSQNIVLIGPERRCFSDVIRISPTTFLIDKQNAKNPLQIRTFTKHFVGKRTNKLTSDWNQWRGFSVSDTSQAMASFVMDCQDILKTRSAHFLAENALCKARLRHHRLCITKAIVQRVSWMLILHFKPSQKGNQVLNLCKTRLVRQRRNSVFS